MEIQGIMPGASVAAKQPGKSWLWMVEKFPAVQGLIKE
jgi:hypothetical protein